MAEYEEQSQQREPGSGTETVKPNPNYGYRDQKPEGGYQGSGSEGGYQGGPDTGAKSSIPDVEGGTDGGLERQGG
ncbi:MAG TPA: hypothetical protein VHT30_10720 [Acidimicrobiales bacterium]|jgi:hypothetical protein|nr:hypothetical protein [Acidimicrobiales bacterium]